MATGDPIDPAQLEDEELDPSQVQPTEKPGFLESLWNTVNPMNLVDAAKAMVPWSDANNAAVADRFQHPYTSATDSAFPLFGSAGFRAGQRVGSGDVRGGLGQLTGDITNAALPLVLPKVPGGITKTGEWLEKSGAALKKPAGVLGALGAAWTHDPTGVAAGTAAAAAPYAVEATGKGLQRLGKALDGLGKPKVERYLPNKSSVLNSRMPVGPAAGEVSPEIAALKPNVDKHLASTSTYSRSESVPVAPGEVAPDAAAAMRSDVPVDRYMPNKSSFDAPEPSAGLDDLHDMLTPRWEAHSPAEVDNITRNTHYADGEIIPNPLQPSEIRDFSPSEPKGEYPTYDVNMRSEHSPYHVTSDAEVPDFSFEAGDPDKPGLTVGEQQPGGQPAPETQAPAEPAPVEAGNGNGQTHGIPYAAPTDLIDLESYFGPGSTSFENPEIQAQATPRKGEEGYVPKWDASNQVYDPQTDSAYLRERYTAAREMAANESLPAETRAQAQSIVDFYAKNLDQRNRLALSNVLKGLGRPRAELDTFLNPNTRTLRVKPFVVPRP